MKRLFLFLSLLGFTPIAVAQQTNNYEAALIPKNLLPYASAVVRDKVVTVEVKDFDNTTYHIKTAITVLNKNGDDAAHMAFFYNKSNKISYIKGMVYDEFGKQLSKFSQSDFQDESAAHDFSLFEDTRVKHYIPAVTQYPYTIVYECELRSKQSLNFADWSPYIAPSASVEKSSYIFTCKPDFNIRVKEINIPSKAEIATDKAGMKTYTWHINNLKAFKPEPYSPDKETYLPQVKIAPEKFEYEGIKGSFTNWQELGKWEYDKLLLNRQAIPEETALHIKELTAGIANDKLKAKKIYEYMQGKTHYISVQIGIGGYQPFLASDVDKLNYGDCKGLVNYTQALLKLVNIDSYYCVVNSGDRKVSMLGDFASMNQGDHVILCIPFKNDTTWLECTSQKIPFGYLGDFTDDRTVLACTPQGGKLMRTPKYSAAGNLEVRKTDITINPSGEISGDINTTFKGLQYANRDAFLDESPAEQRKMIQKVYSINNMTVDALNLKQEKEEQPVTIENVKFTAASFASTDNGKIHFALNPVNRAGAPPRGVLNRSNDVYINDGYTDEDEIIYTLPAGYHSTIAPLNVFIKKPFGNYKATFAIKGGKLIYNRELEVIDGTYSKDLYDDLIGFYEKVEETDHYIVTLTKD